MTLRDRVGIADSTGPCTPDTDRSAGGLGAAARGYAEDMTDTPPPIRPMPEPPPMPTPDPIPDPDPQPPIPQPDPVPPSPPPQPLPPIDH